VIRGVPSLTAGRGEVKVGFFQKIFGGALMLC